MRDRKYNEDYLPHIQPLELLKSHTQNSNLGIQFLWEFLFQFLQLWNIQIFQKITKNSDLCI